MWSTSKSLGAHLLIVTATMKLADCAALLVASDFVRKAAGAKQMAQKITSEVCFAHV